MRRAIGAALGFAFAALALGIFGVSPTEAAVFTVNDTVDAVDVNPGDGICATAAGTCSLRAAVQETNALPGPDTIIVPAGTYALTIPGADEEAAATGDLDVTDVLVIQGAGAGTTIVDGAGLDRLFDVHPPASTSSSLLAPASVSSQPYSRLAVEQAVSELLAALAKELANPSATTRAATASSALLAPADQSARPSLRLSGLTLQNGSADSSGGAVSAINADLSIADCVVENNDATGPGGGVFVAPGSGGSGSSLAITRTVIQHNQAGPGPVGAFQHFGGGMAFFGTPGSATISDSEVDDNNGVAIGFLQAVGLIERTGIRRNSGGGLADGFSEGFGRAIIKESTIQDNQGDGILNTLSPIDVIASTISGNQGLAVYNDQSN